MLTFEVEQLLNVTCHCTFFWTIVPGKNWFAGSHHNISTDNGLHGKCTQTTISGYISTSDSGVGGGSGAAATV